jgi:hypothetical protein
LPETDKSSSQQYTCDAKLFWEFFEGSMGFKYQKRTKKVVNDLVTDLATLNQYLGTISQKMTQKGFEEIYLAISDFGLKNVENLLDNAAISMQMVDRQIKAKESNLPNPYDANEGLAEQARGRKAAKREQSAEPPKPRGRPRKKSKSS